MKRMLFAAALALLIPGEASAQIGGICYPRPAIGVALGLLTHDVPVDPVPAGGGRHGLASTTGTGFEGSVQGSFPISRDWGLTAEAGAGSMGVVLERDAAGNYLTQPTGDDLEFRRLNLGVLHYRPGHTICGYSSIRIGMYRYGYRGTVLTVPGGAAMMGFEVPTAASRSYFFELEISVALTKAQAPVTPAPLATNIRPTFGFRYRF
jgi:hypothetical protein